MDKEQFLKLINNTRRKSKNKWYEFHATVEGRLITIKGFNTWLQIFKVDGIQQWSTMDCSVKQFNDDVIKGLES